MSSLDFLYIALGIVFLVLGGFISYTLYQVAQTVKTARAVVSDAQSITTDARAIKDTLKVGGIDIALWVLGLFDRDKKSPLSAH